MELKLLFVLFALCCGTLSAGKGTAGRKSLRRRYGDSPTGDQSSHRNPTSGAGRRRSRTRKTFKFLVPYDAVENVKVGERMDVSLWQIVGSESDRRRPESAWRRPDSFWRRPDSVRRRPDSVRKRPDSVWRPPDSVRKRHDSVWRRPESSWRRPESDWRRAESSRRRPESDWRRAELASRRPKRSSVKNS